MTMGRLNYKRVSLLAGIVLLLVVGAWWALHAVRHSNFFRARSHVQELTRYLARDEKEFARIESIKQALDAVHVVWCIENRYVLDAHFNIYPEIERKFEAEKAQTIKTIIHALKEFTGEDYGDDVEKWQGWWPGIYEPNTLAGEFCFQGRYQEAIRALPKDMAEWEKYTALTGSTSEGAAGYLHYRIMSEIAMKGDAEWGSILDDPNVPYEYKTEMIFEILENRLGKGSVYHGNSKNMIIPRFDGEAEMIDLRE